MAARNDGFIQHKIRCYIIKKLAKACTRTPLSIKETELAAIFGCTRLTVQRAYAPLKKSRVIITIPGRRGCFINPMYGTKINLSKCLGVLYSHTERTVIDSETQMILSRFTDDCPAEYSYMGLKSTDADGICDEIAGSYLDGCVWLCPPAFCSGAIEKLIKSGFPLVCVPFVFDADDAYPPMNCIVCDHAGHGAKRAECLLKENCVRPAYFGRGGKCFDSFIAAMKKAGRPFDVNFHIAELDSYEKTADFIRSRKPDAITSDGMIFPYLERLGNEINGIDKIKIILPYSCESVRIAQKFAKLDIRVMNDAGKKYLHSIGARAAGKMIKMLNGGRNEFVSEIIKIR